MIDKLSITKMNQKYKSRHQATQIAIKLHILHLTYYLSSDTDGNSSEFYSIQASSHPLLIKTFILYLFSIYMITTPSFCRREVHESVKSLNRVLLRSFQTEHQSPLRYSFKCPSMMPKMTTANR